MIRNYYYLWRDGEPVPVDQYEWVFGQRDPLSPGAEVPSRRHVAYVEWPDGVSVSTVFLEINHAWPPSATPVLFETMIFWAGQPELDNWQKRYATKAEAEAGHQEAVALVRAAREGA